MPSYFLMKSEPDAFSWQQFEKDRITRWDGVRNYQARNHMQSMRMGDEALFYHSNEGREIVGLMKVVREAYPDPTDLSGKFVCVDMEIGKRFKRAVTLAEIKQHPKLQNLSLIKQSRLSVMPIAIDEWKILCKLGG
jgi:predicted RNA-binding protein with PUA-like domain